MIGKNKQLSVKSLFLINLVLLEHSVIMVEDFELVATSHVMLLASVFAWFVTKRRISVGLLVFFILVVSVAWKWILLVTSCTLNIVRVILSQ